MTCNSSTEIQLFGERLSHRSLKCGGHNKKRIIGSVNSISAALVEVHNLSERNTRKKYICESGKSSIEALHYCKMILKSFKKSKLSPICGIIRDVNKFSA